MENSPYGPDITSLVTIPDSVALSGTVSSDGTTVTGTGTDVLADLETGDWIYDAAQKEVRKILSISDRLQVFHLEKAFSVDLAAINLVKVPASQLEEISLSNVGAAPGTIDKNEFGAGELAIFKKDSNFRGQRGFVDPKVVDGTGTKIRQLRIK